MVVNKREKRYQERLAQQYYDMLLAEGKTDDEAQQLVWKNAEKYGFSGGFIAIPDEFNENYEASKMKQFTDELKKQITYTEEDELNLNARQLNNLLKKYLPEAKIDDTELTFLKYDKEKEYEKCKERDKRTN